MITTQQVVGILKGAGHQAAVKGKRDGFRVVGSKFLDQVNVTHIGGVERARPQAIETYRKLFVDKGYVVVEDGSWLGVSPPTMPKL